jgi:hypothetical protein
MIGALSLSLAQIPGCSEFGLLLSPPSLPCCRHRLRGHAIAIADAAITDAAIAVLAIADCLLFD